MCLYTNITWKSVGVATGNTSLTLPETFSELHVLAYVEINGYFYNSTCSIIKNELSTNGVTEQFYLSGAYMANDTRDVRVGINLNSGIVWMTLFNQDGTDMLSNAKMQVYYR